MSLSRYNFSYNNAKQVKQLNKTKSKRLDQFGELIEKHNNSSLYSRTSLFTRAM